MRFLQKWKKAKEAKKKEKETLAQTIVEGLNGNFNKSPDSDSDSEVLNDEPELSRLPLKDSYNFHNGNFELLVPILKYKILLYLREGIIEKLI